MARRKTWPEGVAERRGRKAWPEGVVGRRGRRAWSEDVLAGIAGLFQLAEFFLGSPRLAMMPNRVSKDDTDNGYTFKGRLSSMESSGSPGPKKVYASLLPSLTRCPRSNEILPYGSGENFLVIGPILPPLPTVAKGLVSQDAGLTLCVPLSAFWSLSCSLSVHGQRESWSSTRRPSCHRLGNH